jgi:gliding motility-associated-like protein
MNKFIASLLVILLAVATGSNAQNLIYVGSEEYQVLKENGQLNLIPQEQIISIPGEKILNPDDFAPQISVMGGGSVPSINCNALVPIDNTFIPGMGPNDDGSSALITLPFDFCFYGQSFNALYINNNGNVSFDQPYGAFSAVPFPNNQFSMICPFWGDVDTEGTGEVLYQMSSTHIVIRWHNVGYFSAQTDKINDFQLILTDGIDPILPGGNNVAFSYGDMQWTTGSASQGINGFGGIPAIVGANQGNAINSFVIGYFDHAGSDYDGPAGNADGVSWLDNKTFLYNVCVLNSNLAPIPDGALATCDTIPLCVGDTFNLNFTFLTTDVGETVTTVIDSSGADGFFLNSNTSGSTSVIDGIFIASLDNIGLNTIIFTATDNGAPPASNVVTLNITVSEIVDPVISGELTYCLPGSVQLSLDSAFRYADYEWSEGSTYPDSIINVGTGAYTITAYNEFGCSRTDSVFIQDVGNPVTSQLSENITCYGADNGSINVQTDYPASVQFIWENETGDILQQTNAPTGTDSLTALAPGTYYLTTTDSLGCVNIDTLSITQPDSVIIINTTNPETCEENNGDASLTVSGGTTPYQYQWPANVSSSNFADSLNAGTYIVTITDNNNCVYTDTITVTEVASPTSNFTTTPPIVLANETINFTDSSTTNGDSVITIWNWDFGDGTTSTDQNPTHSYADTGYHTVTLITTNSIGCTDTIIQDIYITPEIVVPNTFTPNGDGQNDFFEIIYLPVLYPGSKLYIYNRWGNKVYHSDNYQNDWDGEKHSEGTYFYTLLLPNGDEKKGIITMIK